MSQAAAQRRDPRQACLPLDARPPKEGVLIPAEAWCPKCLRWRTPVLVDGDLRCPNCTRPLPGGPI